LAFGDIARFKPDPGGCKNDQDAGDDVIESGILLERFDKPGMLDRIGRYEIEGEIDRGGMAVVYLARDPNMDREVAIKVLSGQLLESEVFRKRFEREARVIATFEHPSIVPVYDYGEENGQLYLVMRYMSGGSLADRIKQQPFSFDEAVQIFLRLAPALDQVHARGIIHRDLKPGNILFDGYGNAFISDFGIARLMEGSSSLTGDMLIGTPAYMSPEQVRGEKEIDGRSDIYALGGILYEMLTGKQPYESTTPIGLALKQISEPAPRILQVRPDLPYQAQDIILKAMAKDRQHRYQTAGEMSVAMQAVPASRQPASTAEPESAGKRRLTISAITVVVVLALIACSLVAGWMGWKMLSAGEATPTIPAATQAPTAEPASTDSPPAQPSPSSILAVTPEVPEPAATQPVGSSAVAGPAVFQDDFSDPNSGWERFSDERGSADYYRNHYQVIAELEKIIAWGVANRLYSDVSLVVEATKVSGTDNNYIGVMCRYQDLDNYYLFAIQSSGYYGIEKHKDGQDELLGSEYLQFSDAIHQGNTTNRFQVSCIGDTLTFYLNGIKLIEVKDSGLSSGDVGLAAAAFEVGNTEVLFDNFIARIP